MLYVIDGTGPGNTYNYDESMKNGMCAKLCRNYDGFYYRGPTTFGFETYDIAKNVLRDIQNNAFFKSQPLFLAGHSRGGAAAIYVANSLNKIGRIVDALFLYDAVERMDFPKIRDAIIAGAEGFALGAYAPPSSDVAKNVKYIPENVLKTYHARRDRSLANHFDLSARRAWQRYYDCSTRTVLMSDPNAFKDNCKDAREEYYRLRDLDDAMKLRMRSNTALRLGSALDDSVLVDFENCGIDLAPASKSSKAKYKNEYYREDIRGSHGAIGGSPIWTTESKWNDDIDKAKYAAIINFDEDAIKRVNLFMNNAFKETKLIDHKRSKPDIYPDAIRKTSRAWV